jgi:hypothetical protein
MGQLVYVCYNDKEEVVGIFTDKLKVSALIAHGRGPNSVRRFEEMELDKLC